MDSKGFPQSVLQYVPTPGKLKRMRAVTRPARFSVSGGLAISVMGFLLCVIGIQAFSYSHSLAKQTPQAAAQEARPAAAVVAVAGPNVILADQSKA